MLALPFGLVAPDWFDFDTEINPTSRTNSPLSPFLIGPCAIDGVTFQNFENLWQYSKVYEHLGHIGDDGMPNANWYKWRQRGADRRRADRYPAGRNVKPAYSFQKGRKLSYVTARKLIYIPQYVHLVRKLEEYKKLADRIAKGQKILIRDFDAHYVPTNDWQAIVDDPQRKMGHGFVLAMMLERGPLFYRSLVI